MSVPNVLESIIEGVKADVAAREAVVDFACDATVWRLGTACVLLDAVLAAMRSNSSVVLGVSSLEHAALWIGLVSRFMSTGTAAALSFSTFDRPDELTAGNTEFLIAVPESDLDACAERGFFVLGESEPVSLGALGGQPHRTSRGQQVPVTEWSAMAQVALIDPTDATVMFDQIDDAASRLDDTGLHPALPMALSVLAREEFADTVPEARSVVAEWAPPGLAVQPEVVALVEGEVVRRAGTTTEQAGRAAAAATGVLATALTGVYLTRACSDPAWLDRPGTLPLPQTGLSVEALGEPVCTDLVARLTALRGAGPIRLLRAADLLTAAGLGALIGGIRRAREAGGDDAAEEHGIADDVAPPQPARLVDQPRKPFQAELPHQVGRARNDARVKVEERADRNRHCAVPRRDRMGNEQFLARNAHGDHGRLQHAIAQPTPAGMGGSNDCAGLIAQKNRQAVGRHDRTEWCRRALDPPGQQSSDPDCALGTAGLEQVHRLRLAQRPESPPRHRSPAGCATTARRWPRAGPLQQRCAQSAGAGSAAGLYQARCGPRRSAMPSPTRSRIRCPRVVQAAIWSSSASSCGQSGESWSNRFKACRRQPWWGHGTNTKLQAQSGRRRGVRPARVPTPGPPPAPAAHCGCAARRHAPAPPGGTGTGPGPRHRRPACARCRGGRRLRPGG